MKKKLLSLFAIGALLVQSSGVYAMMGTARSQARRGAEFVGRGVQQYVGAPMGRVASAVSENQRFQAVTTFLIAAGHKAKEGPQVLYRWLQEHRKVATGVVLAIIVVILSVLWKKRMVHRIPQEGMSWEAALKHYNIQKNTETANFLNAVAEADPKLLYKYYENYEIYPTSYQYLLDKNMLKAARAIMGTEPTQQDPLTANIIDYFQAMSDGKLQTDHQVKLFRSNIEQMKPEAVEMTTISEIETEI